MGRTLGAYEVLHAIKAGGMGEVLLARRRGPAGFEQLVAIKTILPSLTSHAKVRTMFLDEARLLARLSHPAIANVHDFGDQDGQLYLVMEYVPGLRFRELTTLRPPPAVAARAVAEACRGLHAAHELRDLHGAPLGVVHRDLSPENLMLGHDGRVKVLDFGIALVKGRDTVTEHGTIKGKPPYMSPEQVRNRPLDRRSDVFSAALVLHELLTGEPVFGGDSLYGVARAVMDDPIAPPSAKAGPLPAGLDDAVMAALVREPDGRTPSAAAFADELERVASQIGGESLEAWAERTLVRERELHRQWLAAILAGDGDSKRIGRASGVLTAAMPGAAGGAAAGAGAAVGAGAGARPGGEAPSAGRSPSSPSSPSPSSSSPAVGSAPAPAPAPTPVSLAAAHAGRTRRILIALILGSLLLGGMVALLMRGCGAAAPSPDAGRTVDAAVPTPVPVADARTIDAAPADATLADAAPLPIDAGRPRRDAGPPVDAAPPRRVDAAPAPTGPPIDAGAAVAPGKISITADPYANIRVDGRDWGTTPVYNRRLAAGPHEIVLVSPDDGTVRLRRTVTIQSGALTKVSLP